jgi:hypothetical protein
MTTAMTMTPLEAIHWREAQDVHAQQREWAERTTRRVTLGLALLAAALLTGDLTWFLLAVR